MQTKHIAEQYHLPFGAETTGKGKKRKVLLPRFRTVQTLYDAFGRHTVADAIQIFAGVRSALRDETRLEMWDKDNKRWIEVKTPAPTK
ncbi:MAG: hypothetical protein ABJA67_11805 [Chthonomonadales bacterium]